MQNSNIKVIAVFIILLCQLKSFGGSLDIGKIGFGARAIALGRSQVAAQDISSIYMCPANAAQISNVELVSMYSKFTEEVIYNYLGLGIPMLEGKLGGIGVAYLSTGVTSINNTALDNSGHPYVVSSFDQSNKMLILSAGGKINSFFSSGVSIKFFTKSFEGINRGSANGFDADLGFIFNPNERGFIGLSAQNILPIDFGSLAWGSGATEDTPASLRIGGKFGLKENLALLFDLDSEGVHSGVEWHPTKPLAIRGGFERMSDINSFSIGAGLELMGVSFDYAYSISSSFYEASTHYFSLGLKAPYRNFEVRPIAPAQEKEPQFSLIDAGFEN
ncbi:MAG: hypothetical protein FD145_317 [Candidatus Saganbacteria bacterium]|uniref:PorV/PorQ family protein n=1 Tax=Candidatus Saganbacteria bacterium TaxID=2575572 RepID=A0A833L232_UNCSA|nr:MAG: hypothetical protein FD145_317 [Candidatus Saganbacteria bacterium]